MQFRNNNTGALASRLPSQLYSTDDGHNWLLGVLDPYHDNNYRVAGVPTADASLSYVQQYKFRRTITRDSTIEPGAFDVHVFFTDVVSEQDQRQTFRFPKGAGSAGVSPAAAQYVGHNLLGSRSFVTIVVVDAGQPIDHVSADWSCLPFDLDATTPYRITSAGFEVHNVTSALKASGACTVWRANPTRATEFPTQATPAGALNQRLHIVTNGVPNSVEVANMLPTSRSWKAVEGCLVVAQPDFEDLRYRLPIMATPDLVVKSQNGVSQIVLSGIGEIHDSVEVPYTTPSGFTPGGAIFTGLEADSVLTLDCRVFIEFAPSLDAQLLPRCTPAAQYDPVALRAAAQLFHLMPPGTEVKNNDLGRWFRNILSLASKALPLVAAVVPHPVAKMALTSAGAAAGAAHGAMMASATSGRLTRGNDMPAPGLTPREAAAKAKLARRKPAQRPAARR